MVDINILEATRELIHLIKRLGIHLTHHKTEKSKVNHVTANLLCTKRQMCISYLKYNAYFFFTFDTRPQ